MDPAFWSKALEQAPFAAIIAMALIVVVGLFIRIMRSTTGTFLAHISASEERAEARDRERDKATEKVALSMDRNTTALGQNSEALMVAARAAASHEDLTHEFREYRREAATRHVELIASHRDGRHATTNFHHEWKLAEAAKHAVEDAERKVTLAKTVIVDEAKRVADELRKAPEGGTAP